MKNETGLCANCKKRENCRKQNENVIACLRFEMTDALKEVSKMLLKDGEQE